MGRPNTRKSQEEPDWLTGLCVSKDDIKASIRKSVGCMLPGLNKQTKAATFAAMVAETKLPKDTVDGLL